MKNKDVKYISSYTIPWYYYIDNIDWTISVVGIACDCSYLWDYGNQDPMSISDSIDLLSQNWLNIKEENILKKDEDEDFYPLIEPIVLDSIIDIPEDEDCDD